jgi:hypothetical protein
MPKAGQPFAHATRPGVIGSGCQSEIAELGAQLIAQIFGTGNGIPPTSGINLINNAALGGAHGGPRLDAGSGPPSEGDCSGRALGGCALKSSARFARFSYC